MERTGNGLCGCGRCMELEASRNARPAETGPKRCGASVQSKARGSRLLPLARARARAASLHWNATVRALLLVTTSTFLSVLLIGGLGYVVFQARQIEELRER